MAYWQVLAALGGCCCFQRNQSRKFKVVLQPFAYKFVLRFQVFLSILSNIQAHFQLSPRVSLNELNLDEVFRVGAGQSEETQ